MLCHFIHQRVKLIRIGYKIRFTVDLHQRSYLRRVVHEGADGALGCHAVSLFGCFGDPFLPQIIDSFLFIAVRFHQRFFTVHHPCASGLPQLFYHCRCNLCHIVSFFPYRKG